MGNYTHLVINANLKDDTPKEIIGLLMYLSYQIDMCPIDNKHSLYDIAESRVIMCGDSCSFDGKTHYNFCYDNILEEWSLTINSSIKNYHKEYQRFLNYIYPYIKDDEWFEKKFLGFIRYEEDENPTLIYNTRNGIEYREADE